MNTTPFIAAASVFYVVKTLFGPEIQPSGGCYRPLEIVTRPGSLLDPAPESPVVGGNHETSQRIADAVFKAFEAVGPERISAGGPTTSGLVLFGGRRADGAWTTLYEVHGGGEGARHDRDGAPVVRVHMSNVMNTPAEVVEAEFPIRIESQRLRQGSGGAGRQRGGEGLHRAYRVLADDMSVTSMFERRVVPPYGLQGGERRRALPRHHRACGRPPGGHAGQGEPAARQGRRGDRRELRRRRLRRARDNEPMIKQGNDAVKVDGKKAIVTGAAKGMGAAITDHARARGRGRGADRPRHRAARSRSRTTYGRWGARPTSSAATSPTMRR